MPEGRAGRAGPAGPEGRAGRAGPAGPEGRAGPAGPEGRAGRGAGGAGGACGAGGAGGACGAGGAGGACGAGGAGGACGAGGAGGACGAGGAGGACGAASEVRGAASAAMVSRTELIVPSPASATSTTRSGISARHRSRQSPSSARGERTPPAVSTRPTSTDELGSSRAPGQRSSSTRSAIPKGGRPNAAAAIGGAIAVSYQRCGAQTSSARSPLAAPRTAASRVAGSSSGS